LLLWIYYSSQILLFGAEFTQVYAHRAGRDVKPSKYAVRVERKEVESPEQAMRRPTSAQSHAANKTEHA
jgi:membrane protein